MTLQVRAVAGRLGHLKKGDRDVVSTSGDMGFRQLYPVLLDRMEHPRGDPRSHSTLELIRLVASCAGRHRTREMTRLFPLGISVGDRLAIIRWLTAKGDLQLNRDMFEHIVSAPSDYPGYYIQIEAAKGLVDIGDQREVDLLSALLHNPKKSTELRRAIYGRLAKTGLPSALKTLTQVRGADRHQPALPKEVPWDRKQLDTRFPARHVDASGAVWGLLEWDGLGTNQDLWIARLDQGRWIDPVFTGRSSAIEQAYPGGDETESERLQREELAKLVEGGGWIKLLVGNRELLKDSDGDGYTDLIEGWIGLDPNRGDSDGDGLKDSLDKNPLAPGGDLTERQKALRAGLEGITVPGVDLPSNLFVMYPPGVSPFEITSWRGLVLPAGKAYEERRKGSLAGFHCSFGTSRAPALRFLDESTAQVNLSYWDRSWGGSFMVTVRRFGMEWFPIDVEVISSSAA